MVKSVDSFIRCPWSESHPAQRCYHDLEWGVPVYDDRKHFEFLILESAQAGLSWQTILLRREAYRQAMADFDPEVLATWGPGDIEALMANPGLIRNRKKMESVPVNARAFLALQRVHGSFSRFIWNFVDGLQIQNTWTSQKDIPAKTDLSEKLSRDLKAAGFVFLGPTTVYAHMQAAGLVNDHLTDCFRYAQVRDMARPFS